MEPDEFFRTLAEQVEGAALPVKRAPTRLKSKIYSAMMRRQAAAGPLLTLTATKAAGHALCVFEEAVRIAAPNERVDAMNPCRVCHARLLAERVESAPIFWPNCPYVEFRRG